MTCTGQRIWNDPANGGVVANMALERNPQKVPFGRSVKGITFSLRDEDSHKPPKEPRGGSFRLTSEVFQQQIE